VFAFEVAFEGFGVFGLFCLGLVGLVVESAGYLVEVVGVSGAYCVDCVHFGVLALLDDCF
jgi:hypothetical protein